MNEKTPLQIYEKIDYVHNDSFFSSYEQITNQEVVFLENGNAEVTIHFFDKNGNEDVRTRTLDISYFSGDYGIDRRNNSDTKISSSRAQEIIHNISHRLTGRVFRNEDGEGVKQFMRGKAEKVLKYL